MSSIRDGGSGWVRGISADSVVSAASGDGRLDVRLPMAGDDGTERMRVVRVTEDAVRQRGDGRVDLRLEGDLVRARGLEADAHGGMRPVRETLSVEEAVGRIEAAMPSGPRRTRVYGERSAGVGRGASSMPSGRRLPNAPSAASTESREMSR